MNTATYITVLGGGPAGLAAGYFARKRGFDVRIYEATDHLGGNAATLQHGGFLFDTGAHRFHDRDPEATAELKALLGDDLRRIKVPSRIYHQGRLLAFPPSPSDLLRKLGGAAFLRAAIEVAAARLRPRTTDDNFGDYARVRYGKTVAGLFLLNYTRKLWGREPEQLSPSVAGERLQGLSLRGLVMETLLGRRATPAHLEGAFYYPRLGYGMIADRLAEACGEGAIRRRAGITRVLHDGGRISVIEVNGSERISVAEVVSTLPLPIFLGAMDPPPPAEITAAGNALQFRNVVLVVLFLNRPKATDYATIYFPEPRFPFTRVYEPKNRSSAMAPEEQTCLCAEIPCQAGDPSWAASDDEHIRRMIDELARLGWIQGADVLEGKVVRLPNAYPILELGVTAHVQRVLDYLSGFSNLKVVGRGSRFVYAHVHDMLRFGMDVAAEYPAPPDVDRGA